MALKFLEDEFLRKMDKLYNKYSAKDSRKLGYNQPYLEIKPTDKIVPTLQRDMIFEGRGTPVIRPAQDLIRIGKFLTSPRGVAFMGLQSLLQTGNTFSETRIVDPTWIIKNLNPFKHERRNRTSADEFGFARTGNFIGDVVTSLIASPGSYRIGKAGRLHRETSDKVSGKPAQNLKPSDLVKTIAGSVIPGLGNLNYQGANSILGLNERPELNVNGKWYVIQLQQHKYPLVGTKASKAGGNRGAGAGFTGPLTVPNITNTLAKKATSWVERRVRQFVNTKVREILNSKKYNWLKPFVRLVNPKVYDKFYNDVFAYHGSFGVFTHRNFIVDYKSARRYLKRHGESTGNTDDVSFLKGNGFLFNTRERTAVAELTDYNDEKMPSLIIRHTVGTKNDAKEYLSPHLQVEVQKKEWIANRKFEIDKIIQDLQTGKPRMNVLLPGTTNGLGYDYSSKNETKIKDSESVYEDTETWLLSKQVEHNYQDKINLLQPYEENKNGKNDEADEQQDLIDFKIKVFGNKGKTIKFRSIIERLNTDIKPAFSTTQYIGRIEKNITYTGVERACSIDFIVHAFSPEELLPIWEKLNYLTSMAFPKGYQNGYMIPPLLKLTIGNIFSDQPVYLNSLNFSIDENTSWDTLRELQVPMSVMVSIGFTLIEKGAMSIIGENSYYNLIKQSVTNNKEFISTVLGQQNALLVGRAIKNPNSPLGRKVLAGLRETTNNTLKIKNEEGIKQIKQQHHEYMSKPVNDGIERMSSMASRNKQNVPQISLPPLKRQ